MAGPGEETAAAEGRSHGDLRAGHADRDQVIGTLKTAYVQGRLTEDEPTRGWNRYTRHEPTPN